MRFTSVCTTASSDPTTSDATASTQITGRQSSRWNGNATMSTRAIAATAPALPTDAMNAVTFDGAPWYTSGDHTWNGTAATLKPRPTTNSATPANTRASLRSVGTLVWKYSTISPMFVDRAAPYSRAMPYNKNADANPPRTKYLRPASPLAVRRRSEAAIT